MVDIEGILKAAVSILVPLGTLVGTLIGFGNRRGRIRKEIRENLELLKEFEADEILRDHSISAAWLRSKIATDTARLSGTTTRKARKKPLPVGSMVFWSIMAIATGLWTWWLVRDGFVWYSVFPGAASFTFFMAVFGMTLNRELPTDQQLPEGASVLSSRSNQEHVMARLALAGSSDSDDSGDLVIRDQVDTVYRFVGHLESGEYERAIELAEPNWILCRIQAWVWNNRERFESEGEDLGSLCTSMFENRGEHQLWDVFVEIENGMFTKAFGGEDNLSSWGCASRRRRLSSEHEMVLLTPLYGSDGYFVESATTLARSVHFIVRRLGDEWRIVNHGGFAPPTAGLPPIWWTLGDSTWDELAEGRNDQ